MPKGGNEWYKGELGELGRMDLPLETNVSLFPFDFGDLAPETEPHGHVSRCHGGLGSSLETLGVCSSQPQIS